jgi:Tol biopolymer transport system component
MELLNREERRKLIGLLLQLPNIEDRDARRLLMADLPRSLRESANLDDPATLEITTLITNAESDTWGRPATGGAWPIITILENALDLAGDSQIGPDIQALLATAKVRAAQQPSPLPTRPDPSAGTLPLSPPLPATRRSGPSMGVIAGGIGVVVVAVLLLLVVSQLPGLLPGGTRATPTATVPPAPERIAFTSRRSGDDDIYVMGTGGDETGLRRLTNDAFHDYSPTWAPDGTRLAFGSYREPRGIYLINADGSGLTSFFSDPSDNIGLAWAPDGQHLAFSSQQAGNYDLYTISINGPPPTRLTTDPTDDADPSWSPDGTRIAFTAHRDRNAEVYVMQADGSNPKNLTQQSADDFLPVWSPDGTRIAFTSRRDGNEEIYVMNPDGSGQTRLTTNSAIDAAPTWSPDSRHLAFQSNRGDNPQNFEIYSMNADGTNVQRLTSNPQWDFQPAWWGPR